MSSSPSDLILFEKQASGENSGSWGTKANTAMSRLEEAMHAITTITNTGSTYTLDDTQYQETSGTTAASHCKVIKCTGTLVATLNLVVPARTHTYWVWNATGGSYDTTINISGGTAITIPQGFIMGIIADGTNCEALTPPCSVAGQQILLNDINMSTFGLDDANGNQLVTFTTVSSAVNEIDVSNNSTGNNPIIAATGGDSNIGINLIPKGTGVIQNNGTAMLIAGKQTIWIPAAAMTPTASSGCAPLAATETTAGRPDMSTLDFDASTKENVQFHIMFPKTWNRGTITYQVSWTTTATDTDGVAWTMQAVACANDDTIDVAYGTAVVVTDDNLSAAEDVLITSESGALTIAGSPAADEICFFRLSRDVTNGNDDMTEDARLLGIRMFFVTNTEDDT